MTKPIAELVTQNRHGLASVIGNSRAHSIYTWDEAANIVFSHLYCCFNFLAALHGTWHHSSPTRDQIHAPRIGSVDS